MSESAAEIMIEDYQFLYDLRQCNTFDGARPVIISNEAEWQRAFRLSDVGMIAIEQLACGGRLHITRKGAKAVSDLETRLRERKALYPTKDSAS